MPPHKNTHLQTAQSRPADQGLQESVFYPNPTIIKNKNLPFFKKLRLISFTDKDISTTKKKH